VADVDPAIVKAVRDDKGNLSISIAAKDKVYSEIIQRVEIFNPGDSGDIKTLIDIAADADEIATALPAVKFFRHVAPWLRRGFEKNPNHRRMIYTAENNNHAAELLEKAVGKKFPNTYYLNTVIGKMSGVLSLDECVKRKLPTLTPSADRGHLVEEFNQILISNCPAIENRKTKGLCVKDDLLPFEEAKLYGHNAIHVLLGLLASEKKIVFMHELAGHPEIIEIGRRAFINESGLALRKKWNGLDELFTENGYRKYAEDLLIRMINPLLADSVERVCRDLERKLGWDDRIIGAIRIVISQGFKPVALSRGAAIAAEKLFGSDPVKIRKGFEKLWPSPWTKEHEDISEYLPAFCCSISRI
jgi:mannitol-1-phosphate 5-dehydrogenase